MKAPSNRFNLTSKLTPEQIAESLEDLTSLAQDKPKDGDSGEFTLQALWRTLSETGDLIIVIDAIDEPRVRKQLSALKAKENAKLKSADIPTDGKTLEFVVHEDKALEELKQVKLQVYLRDKPTVKLHKIIIANGSLV